MSKEHHLSKNELKYVKDEAKNLERAYQKGTPLTDELNKITAKHFNDELYIAYKMQTDSVTSKHLPNVFIRDYDGGQPSKLWVESKDSGDIRADVYELKSKGKSLHPKDKHWLRNAEESNLLKAELKLGKSTQAGVKLATDSWNKATQKIWQMRTEALNSLGSTLGAKIPADANYCAQIGRMLKLNGR